MTFTQRSEPSATTGAPAHENFSRVVLKLDAVVTSFNGIAYLALAAWLKTFLGVETAVLYPVGAFLFVFGVGVFVVGTRETLNRNAIAAIAAANFLWAVLSIGVLISGVLSPTGVGAVWIALQALVVAVFAGLQDVGIKRL